MRRNVWLFVMGALVVALSQWGMPLTYDETVNYNEAAALGPIWALTRGGFYNHAPYTFLMSLVPPAWVTLHPFVMRLPNVIVAVCLFALIYAVFEDALCSVGLPPKIHAVAHVALAASAVLASPELTYFYMVGRGYLLGCTLAFAGLYLRQSKFPDWVSDVLVGLAPYAVATFGYLWPGVLIVDVIEHGVGVAALKRIAWRWIRSCATFYFLFMPFPRQVVAEAGRYRDFEPPFRYSQIVLERVFHFRTLSPALVYTMIAVGIGTYLIGKTGALSQAPQGRANRLVAAYLAAAAVAFFAFAETTSALHLVQPPYVRNAMFVGLFAITSMALSAVEWWPHHGTSLVTGGLRTVAAVAMFATPLVNAAVTVEAVAPPLATGRYLRLPVDNVDCPVPITNRFLASLPGGAEIFCGGFAYAVCQPFRVNMARLHLGFLPGGDDAFDREPQIPRCWSGTEPGERSCSLYVRRTRTDPFQPLCY